MDADKNRASDIIVQSASTALMLLKQQDTEVWSLHCWPYVCPACAIARSSGRLPDRAGKVSIQPVRQLVHADIAQTDGAR